ncbi:MAG TPA: nuclear transport factor 2 family protein [Solirubrobacterales bacterium]|nr:nuclear transport factor 2 family protein [Solirubrobacterales bacterium]
MKTQLRPLPSRRGLACLSLPELLSAGDLEGATTCFARDACLLTQDATAIHTRDRIRPVLAQLISRHIRIEVELRCVLAAGEIGLATEHWTIEIDGTEGSRFEQTCTPTLILHRIEERWKLGVVAPWGWGSAPLVKPPA